MVPWFRLQISYGPAHCDAARSTTAVCQLKAIPVRCIAWKAYRNAGCLDCFCCELRNCHKLSLSSLVYPRIPLLHHSTVVSLIPEAHGPHGHVVQFPRVKETQLAGSPPLEDHESGDEKDCRKGAPFAGQHLAFICKPWPDTQSV